MRPVDEAELAEAVRGANGPLRIVGGGTRGIGRLGVAEVLDVSGLSGITLYEPGALTLVAGAGTPVAEVEAVLAAERQRLAFEVPDLRRLLGRSGASTLGGVVAANASGPRRVQVGACRDALLGVRFVDGAGVVVKNGGRVMKNVTGYDLVKLMAGSQGTLGVLTEVAFKVQAVPEAEATLVSGPVGAAAAVAAMAVALTSPFDVSGAAWDGRVLVRVEGMAGSVAYRAAELAKRLPGFAAVTGADSAALWAGVRDVTAFAGGIGAVWRVAAKPSDAPAVLAALQDMPHRAVMDWGGGLIWLLVEGDGGAEVLRSAVTRLGGHATLIRGDLECPVFHPEPGPVAALTAGLRATFDPRGIFNPGMFGPGMFGKVA
ncbi:MAG: FAD-binding protein [Pseudomonadota bacterium]